MSSPACRTVDAMFLEHNQLDVDAHRLNFHFRAGHGKSHGVAPSAKPDPDVLAALPCQLLAHVLDYFGVKKALLVGHDWGGGVALEFAIRKHQRVLGVVGWCVSYRDESNLAKLAKKKGHVAMCWEKDDLVHPLKKGQALAKVLGIKLCMVRSDAGVLKRTILLGRKRVGK